jgi:hypothetical protein
MLDFELPPTRLSPLCSLSSFTEFSLDTETVDGLYNLGSVICSSSYLIKSSSNCRMYLSTFKSKRGMRYFLLESDIHRVVTMS